jgi:hypothetical protein
MNILGKCAALTAVIGFACLAVAPASAQTATETQGTTAKAPAQARRADTSKTTWTAPKTAWGDPDLSGVWTSDSVRGIPTERPEQLAGKAVLTDEEYAAKVKRDEQTRTQAENAEGRLETMAHGFTSRSDRRR